MKNKAMTEHPTEDNKYDCKGHLLKIIINEAIKDTY